MQVEDIIDTPADQLPQLINEMREKFLENPDAATQKWQYLSSRVSLKDIYQLFGIHKRDLYLNGLIYSSTRVILTERVLKNIGLTGSYLRQMRKIARLLHKHKKIVPTLIRSTSTRPSYFEISSTSLLDLVCLLDNARCKSILDVQFKVTQCSLMYLEYCRVEKYQTPAIRIKN